VATIEVNLSRLTLSILPSIGGRERPEVIGFDDGKLEVQFNPTEYSVDRETTFSEVAIPGLDAPVLQYVRGNGDKMSFELYLDATDCMTDGVVPSGESVRERFVRPLEQLMLQHPRLHAPPPIAVYWGKEAVMPSGVALSLAVKYTLFDTKGRPVRATATLTLREHRSASQQLAETRAQSPDKANVAKARTGDTLPAIAFREYGDATLWRPIATANRLSNPLDLAPGQELVIPKVV
jgi:hypothetical protein